MRKPIGPVPLASRWTGPGLIVFLVSAAAATTVGGRPIEDYDFSLRFPAANTRFAPYADVAAVGGAQAASEWSSSLNPASAAWPHEGRTLNNAVSPQYSLLRFNEGTDLSVFSEAVVLDAGAWGVFLPAAAQVRSNHAPQSTGVGFQFDSDYFQLQWGKKVAKTWAIGAACSVSTSDTRLDFAKTEVARSRGESYGFRVGILHQALPTIRVGLVVDYGFAPSRTDVQVFDPATFKVQKVRSMDTTGQFLTRTGLTWEYSKGSTLNVDYQSGVFSNDTGKFRVHRFPIGIEHLVIKDILFIRAGTLIDSRGRSAVTGGLGVSLSTRASVDLAYQRDMFPEITPEFGSGKTYTVSVSIAF